MMIKGPIYFLTKIFEILVFQFILITTTFFLLHALPGGPFDSEQKLNPIVQQKIEESWGIHQPIAKQYTSYVENVLKGDFGYSISKNLNVGQVIIQSASQTFYLSFVALIFVFFLGLVISIVYIQAGQRWRNFIDAIILLFISLPSLFIGPVLIWFFAFYLGWLPVAFLDSPLHYILPVLTLMLRPLAQFVKILTVTLDESMQSDYIRTAKAKGLSNVQIIYKHALKNSLIPILSYSTPLIVGLFSGSFIVELLFSINGLGYEFSQSLALRDYPLCLGITIYFGFFILFISTIIQMIIHTIDPRIGGIE